MEKYQMRASSSESPQGLRKKSIKQGRIVHWSGLNNKNNINKDKNSLKSKMKDFIFKSTTVKADIF